MENMDDEEFSDSEEIIINNILQFQCFEMCCSLDYSKHVVTLLN
jgi:hypothetical protein